MTTDILDNVPERFKLVIERLKEAVRNKDYGTIRTSFQILGDQYKEFEIYNRFISQKGNMSHSWDELVFMFAVGFLTGARWGMVVE